MTAGVCPRQQQQCAVGAGWAPSAPNPFLVAVCVFPIQDPAPLWHQLTSTILLLTLFPIRFVLMLACLLLFAARTCQ